MMSQDLFELLFPAVKAGLLLGSVYFICKLFRRYSASARYFLLMAALFAGLLIPFLSFGTGWELPVFPPPISDIQFQNTPLENTAIPETPSEPLSIATWLISIWIIVALFLMLRTIAGNILADSQVRKAKALDDPAFIALASDVSQQLGLKRGVRFLISENIAAPITCGALRSKILLPGHFKAWNVERQRLVLLHEMAHVKRRDCLTQFITQIVCSVYWFNPLVWYAARYLRELREQACDDQAISAGTTSSIYAGHLLDIARSINNEKRVFDLGRTATVAMARRSGMEGRILYILDPRRSRRSANRLIKLAAIVTIALFAVPLSALQLRSQPVETFPDIDYSQFVPDDASPHVNVQDAVPKKIVRNSPIQKADRKDTIPQKPANRVARLASLGPLQSSLDPLRGELAPLGELKRSP